MASSRATAVVTIVDDDDSYREALGSFIRSLSFDVQSFASAGDFLAAPRPTVSHCLILDYEMPGMSGLALQRRLAELGEVHPIIFVTAHDDAEIREQAMRSGALGFLPKPPDQDELVNLIPTVLAPAA